MMFDTIVYLAIVSNPAVEGKIITTVREDNIYQVEFSIGDTDYMYRQIEKDKKSMFHLYIGGSTGPILDASDLIKHINAEVKYGIDNYLS